ncbi:MAG TPA: nitronate monooxygenase [Hyphomicrobiaceae bacterium]|nr:nitronate monooxygenase [Hyphomicrobiaceae bacterium]
MPISTPLTQLLGIAHPILLAPMDLVADGRLAASVTEAGGLGLIGGGYGDAAWLERELAAASGTRVGVGFITWSLARNPSLLDLVLERQPAAVMLSFGDVTPFAARIRNAGARLICQVQTVEQARSAASAGADVIVAQGGEAGGHGISRGTFALVPAVCDAVRDIPVVAAGGVADGRGLAAALMLGAAGVLVGTRFYATVEAAGAHVAKQAIVDASGDRTIRSILFDIARRNVWPSPYTGRVLQNEFSERWRGREAELMQRPDEMTRYAEARAAGDFRTAAVIAGEGVDLVADVPPAGEVVRRMVREAEGLVAGASNRFTVDQGR